MNCAACGSGVDHEVTLSDEKLPSNGLSAHRWDINKCRGLTFNGELLSPPCGWFQWTHEVRT